MKFSCLHPNKVERRIFFSNKFGKECIFCFGDTHRHHRIIKTVIYSVINNYAIPCSIQHLSKAFRLGNLATNILRSSFLWNTLENTMVEASQWKIISVKKNFYLYIRYIVEFDWLRFCWGSMFINDICLRFPLL